MNMVPFDLELAVTLENGKLRKQLTAVLSALKTLIVSDDRAIEMAFPPNKIQVDTARIILKYHLDKLQ